MAERQSAHLVDAMRAIGTEMTLTSGAVLFQQEDSADAIFTLCSGRLEVSIVSEGGRRTVLNVLSSGDIFGELALLENASRTATVTASTDATLLRVGRETILRAMESSPKLAIGLLQMVIGREKWMSDQFGALSFDPLEIRLARRLLFLRSVIGDARDRIAVSQNALGDHTGATREAVSKIVAGWKDRGIVATHRGGITLLKPDVLAGLADDPKN